MLTTKDIAKELDIKPFIADIILSRGIDTKEKLEEFISKDMKYLHDPHDIPNIDKIVKLIKEHAFFSSIAVFADYDADGVSSAYVLYKAINRLADNVELNIYLGNRFRDGYGLSKKAVDIIYNNSQPELLVTLDCGISNQKEIEYANQLGMKVAVIDHHEADEKPNFPFVDLKVEQGNYPFAELCGAGLTWKVGQALLDDDFEDVLDVVSLATVADVVPLLDENRIIANAGIEQVKRGEGNEGLEALLEVTGTDKQEYDSTGIGFTIGPLINATGRLKSPYPSLKLLLEEDPVTRAELATELKEINEQRKKLTKEIMNRMERDIDDNKNAIVCESRAHQGLVGLVAGRIKSKYNKPSIVVDKMSRKGSGRSVEPFNLYKNLKICQEEGVIESAGGHEMAAGLSVSRKDFNDFKERFNQLAEGVEYIDVVYEREIEDLSIIDDNFIYDMEYLEPFGQKNPKPLFISKDVSASSIWVLPGNEHVKFKVAGIEAIAFRQADMKDALKNGNINIYYTVGFNNWNGNQSIQLIVRKIEPST